MKKLFFLLGLILLFQSVNAQYSIKGIITDENSEPLVGVTVSIEGTFSGTLTGKDGSYQLNQVQSGEYYLLVRYIGYEPTRLRFTITDSDVELSCKMAVKINSLEEVTVQSVRTTDQSGIAHTDLSKADIQKNNLGVDMPYLLEQTPSVVVTSDAGNGVGYTGIRIRGSDPTRVNITLNGIPMNDAESQGTYWVDLPDFASSVNSIQIQRGVGSSTNGAGAFGGTVNLSTNDFQSSPYGEINNSYGSFNTHKHTLKLGTGLINDHFTFDLRLSSINSDGYIDRAFSDLKSFYTSFGYFGKNNSVRLNIFSGKEKTYQAWGGVPSDWIDSVRTYNPYTYENETDNYWQTHYQLFFNQKIGKNITANIGLHFTNGYGYYEQYKEGKSFSEYGLNDVIIGADTITSTNLIQQQWLDNDFYGAIYSVNYNSNGKLDLTLGGAWNTYKGAHFGEVIWSQYFSNGNINHRWYDNDAVKIDFNIYLKANYRITDKLSLYGDAQFRSIDYTFLGYDKQLNVVDQQVKLIFLNPKAGIYYAIDKKNAIYGSFAMGNKEPNRDDYTSSSPDSRPTAETLYDFETGYRFKSGKLSAGFNAYYMNYKNQLVLTGKINDVGNYIRTNIPESYRAGVEIDFAYNITKKITWRANATLSSNKIVSYTEFVDNWDTWGQDSVMYSNTDIAFSPGTIAASEINFLIFEKSDYRKFKETKFPAAGSKPIWKLNFAFVSKYVGKQFIDNTSSDDRALDAYLVNDGRLTLNYSKPKVCNLSLNFTVRNLFNELYSSNAWVYRYSTGGSYYKMDGFYPQAGINYLVGLDIRF